MKFHGLRTCICRVILRGSVRKHVASDTRVSCSNRLFKSEDQNPTSRRIPFLRGLFNPCRGSISSIIDREYRQPASPSSKLDTNTRLFRDRGNEFCTSYRHTPHCHYSFPSRNSIFPDRRCQDENILWSDGRSRESFSTKYDRRCLESCCCCLSVARPVDMTPRNRATGQQSLETKLDRTTDFPGIQIREI